LTSRTPGPTIDYLLLKILSKARILELRQISEPETHLCGRGQFGENRANLEDPARPHGMPVRLGGCFSACSGESPWSRRKDALGSSRKGRNSLGLSLDHPPRLAGKEEEIQRIARENTF
jgi:hypothetical protein